nr:MAG TPA: hypothetical protein [Caudoviricetes sp.]
MKFYYRPILIYFLYDYIELLCILFHCLQLC